jgi:cysteine desulfurase/selenocysteine lyase
MSHHDANDSKDVFDALVPRTDFWGLADVVHLAGAGETPFLRSHEEIFKRFSVDKSGGMAGRDRIIDTATTALEGLSKLMGVRPEEIGFPLNVAQGMNMVARVVAASGRGNVVMSSWEYPSLLYPWARLPEIEVRLVKQNDYIDALAGMGVMVDENTKAIVTSHVSYFTGEKVDLAKYRELADSVGALLIVDASHSLGVLSVDVRLADFVFCCCYKWLLGAHGSAVFFCNRVRQPNWQPIEVGWTSIEWQDSQSRSADIELVADGRLFELGNPALLSVCLLGNAVEYLRAVGSGSIERHVLAIGKQFGEELRRLGLWVLTPWEENRRGASVVFGVDNADFWRDGLEAAGILAWIGEGRVRLSPYMYTSQRDVDFALERISQLALGRTR